MLELEQEYVFESKLIITEPKSYAEAITNQQSYLQKEGIDYYETFAPVAKYQSIRAIRAIGAIQDYEIHQMDVISAFLNGDIDAEIYMVQPEGYVVKGQENMVCKLHKCLYGLKQASKAWYKK